MTPFVQFRLAIALLVVVTCSGTLGIVQAEELDGFDDLVVPPLGDAAPMPAFESDPNIDILPTEPPAYQPEIFSEPPVTSWPSPPTTTVPSGQGLQAVAPPPGTLGRTYLVPSALIPKDEHPRTAMIDVHVTGFSHVEVLGLEDFEGFLGNDGVWHFTSKRPLLPGTPHIYQVIAHDGTPSGTEDVRTVRMIPGRIVRLDF